MPAPEFALINFDEAGDDVGREIRKLVPSWNIATKDLLKFQRGEYDTMVKTVNDIKAPEAHEWVLNYHRSCVSASWEAKCPLHLSEVHQADAQMFQLEILWNNIQVLKYMEEHPEQEQLSQLLCHGAKSVSTLADIQSKIGYWLNYLVRKTLTSSLLWGIISRIRKLTVAPPLVAGGEDEVKVVDEDRRQQFGNPADELAAHLKTLDFIVADHQTRNQEEFYRMDVYRENQSLGGVGRIDHWSLLFVHLQREVAHNGPLPAVLDRFYNGIELASRLEQTTSAEYTSLEESAQGNELVLEMLSVIQAARRFFGIK